MKAKIINTTPALAPGQLWKHFSGTVYLAVQPQWAVGKEIFLLNTTTYTSVYSVLGGFNHDQDAFTYIGNLEITE